MANYRIVKNMNTLKAFEKRGLVTFCRDTGTKIEGLYSSKKFTCYYIDEAKSFEHKGKKYREKYFSGCFYPYLIEVIEA